MTLALRCFVGLRQSILPAPLNLTKKNVQGEALAPCARDMDSQPVQLRAVIRFMDGHLHRTLFVEFVKLKVRSSVIAHSYRGGREAGPTTCSRTE